MIVSVIMPMRLVRIFLSGFRVISASLPTNMVAVPSPPITVLPTPFQLQAVSVFLCVLVLLFQEYTSFEPIHTPLSDWGGIGGSSKGITSPRSGVTSLLLHSLPVVRVEKIERRGSCRAVYFVQFTKNPT